MAVMVHSRGNPFIDPETSREHFPLFEAGLAVAAMSPDTIESPGNEGSDEEPSREGESDGSHEPVSSFRGRLDWSIDTLAHMAAARDEAGHGLCLSPDAVTRVRRRNGGGLL